MNDSHPIKNLNNNYLNKFLNISRLSRNLINRFYQNSTTKNCGIILLVLNFFLILIILFKAIYKACLKFNLKWKIKQDNVLKKIEKRSLKNAKSYNLKFDKKMFDKFKLKCKKNGISIVYNLENFMIDYINEGVNLNVKKPI